MPVDSRTRTRFWPPSKLKARAGEGVLGLRRGFLQAGAQNLLLTLWPVEDGGTAAFMSDFYAAAFRTPHPALALAEVQREWLKKLRTEKGVAEACRIAGPFILSFQGKPDAAPADGLRTVSRTVSRTVWSDGRGHRR